MRVLIVKRDKLGDLLLTTPVLERLAGGLPHAEIHLLANDYNAWVVRDHPALARIWQYPRVREGGRLRLAAAAAQIPLAWRLRRQRFDWAFVMGGEESHRAIRRAIATGATRVVAYARDQRRYGARLTDAFPPPETGHETQRMIDLLAPLGLAARDRRIGVPTFALPETARTFAQAWLAGRDLAAGGYVVVGAGARRPKKQPTPGQILRWSARLHEALGLPTVFMWTPGTGSGGAYPGDDALAEAVLARARPYLHPFRGPIPEALGLIFHARTSILPDSGLMHFAAASPGGVLGLFADPADSSPAARWAPRGARARHLEAPVTVAELPDDAVFDALDALLETAPAA